MFKNLEKVIRDDLGNVHIAEERYGPGLLAGFDVGVCIRATNYPECTFLYEGSEVADAIETATGPGDMNALTALSKLVDYAEQHPAFLFARAETLAETLALLDVKAGLWNQLSLDQKDALMLGFIAFEGDPFGV